MIGDVFEIPYELRQIEIELRNAIELYRRRPSEATARELDRTGGCALRAFHKPFVGPAMAAIDVAASFLGRDRGWIFRSFRWLSWRQLAQGPGVNDYYVAHWMLEGDRRSLVELKANSLRDARDPIGFTAAWAIRSLRESSPEFDEAFSELLLEEIPA